MEAFDYNREAELFPAGTLGSRRKGFSYRRFDRVAEAIQFAMKALSSQSLAGAYLEVDEQRFNAEGIRLLYESEDYPLTRSATRAASLPRKTHNITERTIDLDQHRGMAAQKATDQRRLLAEVEANERSLRLQRDELETQLLAAPSADWQKAAMKARYLLSLFVASPQRPASTAADCSGACRFRSPIRQGDLRCKTARVVPPRVE